MKPATAIYRLFRRTQMRNRRVGRSEETGLSLAESHLLIELDSSPGQTITELTTALSLAQGFTSRLVQSLVKRKLITALSDKRDSRRKTLTLTHQGRVLLSKVDEIANSSYHSMIQGLSRGEQEQLTWLAKILADGLGSPASPHRPCEAKFRTHQRRLTRSCGILSESVFGSSLSVTMWQILSEIVLSPVPPNIGELASSLSLAHNSVSSMISQMEQKGYITRTTSLSDGRSVVVQPRAAGERLYYEVEQAATNRIQLALQAHPKDMITQAVKVYHRAMRDDAEGLPTLPPDFSFTEVSSDDERSVVRGFIARSLIKLNAERELPSHFVSRDHECFILWYKGTLFAALSGDR
jgi:DNA-binding MarR family transcriptional regulator